MAFRNLFRNSKRTVATAAAVIAGFVGLLLLGGYIYRVEISLRTNSIYLFNKGHITVFKNQGLERFGTNPAKYQILPQELEGLKQVLEQKADNIDWVGQTLTGAGLISNGDRSMPFLATGIDLLTLQKSFKNEMVKKWALDFLVPGTLKFVDAVEKDLQSISITPRLAEYLKKPMPFANLQLEDQYVQLMGMTQYSDMNAVDGRLAVNHTTGSEMLEDSGLLSSVNLLQDLYALEGIHYAMIYLKPDVNRNEMLQFVRDEIKNKNLPLEAFPFDHPSISPNYVGSMGFLYVMSGFFIFLICGAVALSIMNSLTMGIIERTREIGTFRALGFSQKQISWMMTQESIWLCFFSSLLGGVLAFVVSAAVNAANIRFTPPGVVNSIQFILTPNLSLALIVFFVFLAIVSITAYLVTFYKMKTKIINLLSDAGA
ncbi:MAG: ABC transporter permease [Bdellovibrionales bacterium]